MVLAVRGSCKLQSATHSLPTADFEDRFLAVTILNQHQRDTAVSCSGYGRDDIDISSARAGIAVPRAGRFVRRQFRLLVLAAL
jgi:hypothetical protein